MITIYTQPDCRPCKRVIGMFDDADVSVDIVDIADDLIAKDFVIRGLQGKSTPIIHDDETGETIRGYQPTETKNLIERIKNGVE